MVDQSGGVWSLVCVRAEHFRVDTKGTFIIR